MHPLLSHYRLIVRKSSMVGAKSEIECVWLTHFLMQARPHLTHHLTRNNKKLRILPNLTDSICLVVRICFVFLQKSSALPRLRAKTERMPHCLCFSVPSISNIVAQKCYKAALTMCSIAQKRRIADCWRVRALLKVFGHLLTNLYFLSDLPSQRYL